MQETQATEKNPRYFRLVCAESEIPAVLELLAAQGFGSESEDFSPLCRRLTEEPFALGASLAAYFGLIYIQDRSSMLPPLALAPAPGAKVLDVCASPGGKSGFLAQLAGEHGFVLANEPGPDRLATLRQNLMRLNLAQAATCGFSGEALPLPDDSFEYILLDPPCSGWGTAEKHPKTLTLWSPGKTGPLIALQRLLLREACRVLAPGGRMVYSTCTTNVEENEEQTIWATQNLPLTLTPLEPFAGMSFTPAQRPGINGVLRVDAAKSRAQGFYLCAFRKAEAGFDEFAGRAEPELTCLDQKVLTRSGEISFSRLPPGRAVLAKGKLWWLAKAALELCAKGFLPRGYWLGGYSAGEFRPQPRARILAGERAARLNLDSVQELTRLVSGQSLMSGLKAKRAVLHYKDLPLGWLTLKSGRALWSGR